MDKPYEELVWTYFMSNDMDFCSGDGICARCLSTNTDVSVSLACQVITLCHDCKLLDIRNR